MKQKPIVVASIVIIALALAAVGAFFAFKGSEYVVYVEQEKIQGAIDKKLPYEKRFALIFKLTFSNTRIELTNGSDRIGASTDVTLDAKLKENLNNLGGFVKSEAGIRYDQEKFCFFIVNPEIQEVEIKGIPEKYTDKVSAGARPIVEEYLRDIKVFTIKDENLKLKLAKAVLKNVEVVDGKLALTLGY